jgi:hypothetical protein
MTMPSKNLLPRKELRNIKLNKKQALMDYNKDL